MAVFTRQFYHSTIKNMTIGFGRLFSDLYISRSNGDKMIRTEVPIAYAPKEKFIQRLTDQELMRQNAIQLPRMAFEMTAMMYDAQRKLPRNKKVTLYDTGPSNRAWSYTPVPYDLTYNLYITAKTQDDMFQIVEQIIPGFTPDLVLNMKSTQTADFTVDVPIFLEGVTGYDSFDGSFDDNRVIMWTLTFVMKAVFFSPIRGLNVGDVDGNVIREIDVYTYGKDDTVKFDHFHFIPYLDGVPLADIREDDPWTLKTTIDSVFPL